MILRKLAVVIVALALGAVAIGVGYIILAPNSPVTPPGAAPKVTITSPLNQATGVLLNAKVTATFNNAMDPTSFIPTTFALKLSAVPVAGTTTYSGMTVTFSPSANLIASTLYTATVTSSVKDTNGRFPAGNYEWQFTTGRTADTGAPLVSFTSPTSGAVGTAINAKVLATFSKPMDPTTITTSTFTVMHGASAVAGTVTYAGTTATFVPTGNLLASTGYTATITTGVKDQAGHALAVNFAWGFTTGATPDTVRPRVSSTAPSGAVPVNSSISATFSEVMDPLTITAATFTLKQGTTVVAGSVSYAGLTATFDPTSDLSPLTNYAATITNGAKDLAGNELQGNFVWNFATRQIADTTRPLVSSTSPRVGVAVTSSVSATFSEAMDPLTITTGTFTLSQGTTSVSGLVSYAGFTATFDPTSTLAGQTTYTATLTNSVRDLAGNAMLSNYVWTLTTAQDADTVRPMVTSTSPSGTVPLSSSISATFSEAMDPTTISVSTFSIMQGTTPVSGLVSYTGFTATFDPSSDFTASTTYTATIATGAQDLAGNGLQNEYQWSFTTGVGADTGRPTVSSTSPITAVALDSSVTATFSEAMDPTTITVTTFTVTQGTNPISGLVTYNGLTATFDPSSDFVTDTTYTGTITTEATDLAGNGLETNFVWTFSTAAGACAQLTVNLGAAASFAALAGATVTNTGSTTIVGDVGVSPGTSITGFPPGTVTGTIHYTDTASAAGIADLTTAYNDAAGRTLCPIGIAGDIGGQTLTPGLYKSTSGLEVTTADLTLDAQGNANAIWIFQIASTLDVADGKHMILAGGALASNIFWQVGTSAIFGTTSVIKGTVMADQSITLNTGAVLDGRALARIAAVNFDGNAVTRP